MKKLVTFLAIILLSGCADDKNLEATVRAVDGANGSNGHSLVSQVQEVFGCECDEQGGERLDIYLDNDDNLFVSEGDTFQSSLIACNGRNGLQGIQGLPGVQGAAGEAGPQGIPGISGPQGLPGPQGLTGSAGATGNTGAQGIAGPVGPVGPTGPQGAMGPSGPQGPAGALLQNYTLNSTCQSIGDGFYAKKSGDDAKIYDDNDCSNSDLVSTIYAEHVSNGDASLWLTATRLAFNDNNGNLRVIKFN